MHLLPRCIEKYLTTSGRCPFDEWLESLKDKKMQAIVATRLNRVIQGNFGLCRQIDKNIWELKINFGPGLRIYFAMDSETIVLLLCGGDKSTQAHDIVKAKTYWIDYCK